MYLPGLECSSQKACAFETPKTHSSSCGWSSYIVWMSWLRLIQPASSQIIVLRFPLGSSTGTLTGFTFGSAFSLNHSLFMSREQFFACVPHAPHDAKSAKPLSAKPPMTPEYAFSCTPDAESELSAHCFTSLCLRALLSTSAASLLVPISTTTSLRAISLCTVWFSASSRIKTSFHELAYLRNCFPACVVRTSCKIYRQMREANFSALKYFSTRDFFTTVTERCRPCLHPRIK